MAQGAAPAPAPASAPVVAVSDTMGTVKKAVATAATLAVFGTGSWLGYEKFNSSRKTSQKAIGVVAGVGSVLLGLATVAALVAPPRVTSVLLTPFNLPYSA
jgi:hypothetical protein